MSDRGWNVTTKFNNAVLLSLAAMLCLFSSAIARAQLTVTATSVNFGNVVVDQTSGSKSITVQNGGASATFSQVSVNLTPPYAISPSSTCASGVTLAHKGICTITLTATPSVIGAMPAGTLTLASNASNSPQEISLSGTGIGVAQTITFSNPGTQTAGTPLPLIATATSGLTVAFTSATTSVCTVSGTTASFIAAGTCTIHANQAGNTTYAAAPQVAQSFTVNKEPQTITFNNPGTQTAGTPLPLVATATSGLTVAFTSATTSVCTVSGTTASFIAAGTCTIHANQAGNTTYAAAPQVAQSFTVNKEPQTITFNNPGTQTAGTPLPLVATATSGLTVAFTSATTSVCTVSGTTASFIAAGTCAIHANQAGNAVFAAAPQVAQSFTVNKEAQTITFNNPGAQTVGTPLPLIATATSGLTVAFTSATTSVCTVSGTTASFIAAGTCTIHANQAGNAVFAAAPQVAQSFSVNAAIIILSPTSLPAAQVGASYSQTITASGGASPYTYTVTAGSLPAGLTLSSSGTLSGTPKAGGSFTFTVSAKDSNNITSAQSYTLTVSAPTISFSPATLPSAQVGVAYSQTITASGGTSPYHNFSVTAGSLPAGLTLSSSGVLSGTPTVGGSFSFTVSATDSSTGAGPYTAGQSYTLTVTTATITLSPTSLPAAQVGASYSQTITASGGVSPYTYTVTAGSLPAGVTLSSSGTVSGTPTAGGAFSFTATAKDSNNVTGSQNYTLTVSAPTISFSPATLPSAQVGVAYSQTITASGGTSPYHNFSVTAGSLPAGLTLSSSGVLSGTPTVGGSFSFTVSATDSSTGAGPYTAGQSYTLTVTTATITLSPTSLPAAQVGASYSQTITASGGVSPYTYTVTAGSLPAGVTLSSSGTVSGTPTAGGAFSFTATAKDSNNVTGSQNYTLTVSAPTISFSPATLPSAQVGVAYSQTITASGGTSPYHNFSVTAGSLPAGLTLSSSGVLSGTPTAGGSFSFTVSATDSSTGAGPYTAGQSYTLTVTTATITLSPTSLPAAQVGASYSQTITASGGVSPYTYTVTAGSLPAGVTLSSSGTVSGTPTAGGSFSFTATAKDSNNVTGSQNYTLTVSAPTISFSPATLPSAQVGVAYSQTITASGGTSPYHNFSVTAGSLPAGLTLSSSGVLSGTPTAGGSFSFTVSATDSSTGAGPYTAGQSYTLTVTTATITLSPTSLPAAQVGASYSQTITASGGVSPYTYTVTAGSLPAGLTLSSSGTVSGTPTAGGSFSFTATAKDSNNVTGSQNYTLTVSAPTISFSPATLPSAQVGVAYSQTITASGGTSPYHNFSVTAGSLPAGLTLSSSGVLSGTPTAGGSFSFTVSATDSSTGAGPYTAGQNYTLTVTTATQTITFSNPGTQTVGTPLPLVATATSGLTVAFSSATTSVCTVSGTTASFIAAGTCTIDANQAGNTTYAAAPQVAQTFTVNSAGPAATASPATLTFTAQLVGTTSGAMTVTLTNNQPTQTLHFSGASITGTDSGDFSWANSVAEPCGSVAPAGSCQLLVYFAPLLSGTRTAQLNISDDASNTPQTVQLTGPGNAPVSVLPGSITNFTAPVGSTSTGQTITITNNNASTSVTIYSFQLTNSNDFKQASTSCGNPSAPPNLPPYTLNAGASCNVVIQFAPTIGGTRTGQLQVNDSDPTSPQVVNLSGSATSPLTALPTSLNFSATMPGTVSPGQNITLHNFESQPENFTLNPPSGYSVLANNCPSLSIAANSSCIISVAFSPGAGATNPSTISGTFSITDTAAVGSPLTVALTGSVGNPEAAVASVTPGIGAAGNTSLSVVILGNGYTHFNASSVISFVDTDSSSIPSDITVTVPTPSSTTANQIAATLNIGANTVQNPVTYGARNITVTTPLAGGGTETAFLNSAFTIYDPTNVHTITVVNPSSAAQGQTLDVGLSTTDTNFIQGTTIVNFGTGITVNSLQINAPNGPNAAVANITVSNTTTTGYRTIVMSTGGEYASASPTAFEVTPNNATLVSVSESSTSNVPVVEPQSFAGPIYLTATGTHFLQDATQVSIGGGVIVGDVTVTSPTTATAQVALSSATPGTYSVTVSTGGETSTLANSVTVTGSTPALTSVIPSAGTQGQNGLNIVITGNAFTNFSNTGGNTLTLNMTGLIQVTNLVVNNPNQVTATVNISQTMPVGTITATLVSDDGGTTINYPFAFTVNPSNASIVSVQPPCVPQGGQLTLTLVGSNTIWSLTSNPVTSAAFYPEPVPAEPFINELQVQDMTDATLNITVPTGTPVGNYPFYLATGGQVVNSSICVYANTPSVMITPANGLVPSSGSNPISVTFNGQFTNWSEGNADPNQNTQLPVIAGEGVTISNFVVNSPVSATATISIASGAATGSRLVTVTTGAQILTTYFNVTSTPVGIVDVIPYHAAQNITLNVQIVGLNTHFCDNVTTACAAGVNPSVVQFGPEITVNNVSVQDNTHLTANITTSFTFEGTPTATTPGYQTVYVNTGSEQVLGGFSVDAPASPTLVSVVPSSTPQGSTVDVTITGSLTNWVQGTTEAILGAGVTVANLTITSPTTATATLSVSPTAPVGGNSVTMITGSEVVGGVGFSVTPSNAYIQSVGPLCQAPANDNNIAGFNTICGGTATGTPYVVSQLQTTTLNVVGVGTHWIVSDPTCGNSCGTSFSFGGGVVIDALNVTSATTATVQITVLSNSPVGFVSLTAITGGETVTLQQAIDIEEGFPTLLAIAPTSGSQGATITDFQVLGRFTHFCDNVTTACAPGYSPTQLSFSGTPGITASNISVTDNDTLTATINIAPTAYVDYSYPCGHVLTVETSANEEVSTAPILDNFCVTQGPAQINSVSLPAIPAGNTGTITITGSSTHFQQGVTTVSFGDPNLSVPNGDVTVTDATHLTATIAASTSATPGTKTVTVSTFGEVASEQFAFSVLPDQPVLTESNPYQAEQGQQLYLDPPQPGINVVLTGQYTHFSNLSTATFGPGIVVNSVTWQSTTQVTANITIDPLSYTGGRTVTVTTPGVPCSQQPVNITYVGCSPGQQTGTGSEVVSASIFQIIPGPAIISNVTPNTGNEGQEVVFNITGTSTHWQQNFTQFYIAGGGSDLTVNSVIINSPTSATVDMNISPTANPGARSIYMSTAGESLTDGGAFVVTGGVPAIAYISPNSAAQGAGPVEVTIHGIYTLWTSSGAGNSCLSPQAPASTTLNFGPGVTVVSCQVDDNFNIEAVLSVSANATLGYNVFSVVTGTQVLTGNFLVTAPPGTTQPTPFIWQETPSTGLPGQTLNVYFSGLYTSWNPSSNLSVGTCMSAGTGIQVNTFQVTGLGSALANITITATGSQTNQIVFSTPCQGSASPETETADFNVVVAQPVLSVVDPGSAVQGATNVTVNILGQFTAFDSTTTFSFGPNITVVGSPTILGPTVATQVISIPQLAQTGGNAVVATTPDAPPIAQVVSGASFSITPSLASILAITPNVAQQGVTGFIVEVTGQDTHWDGATIFQFGDGITVTNTEVNSETDATITLSVPAYASEGPTYVSATTGGEVASISNGFVVSAGTPYLLSSGPGSLPQQGSATFTILAQQTGWSAATPPVVSYGTGVNISAVNVTSPQSLTVTGSIQATTPVGYRNLTVTNGTQVLTLSNVLYVSPGPAVINSISPNTGGQGVNLPTVQIHGTNTNWAQGVTTLTFPGALVNSFTVNGPTLITANITVSAYAPAGQVSVTATTLGEVATGVNVFTVTQTQPELLAVVPSSAPQGWTTQNVTLTGDFTHFCDNVTTTCPAGYAPSVANFGAGILVNSVTANGFGSLVANVTVEPTASLGYRTVSVVTGAEAVQIVNAFDVITGPAAIASLSPASGKQNTSLTVLVTGSQTHFCDNVAVVCQNGSPITAASFGGGIQVTGISAVDASHANVNITIPSTTALGQYNVTLTTGGEVATILGGFQVLSGTPALTQVNPATGTQGTSENITITGLFTHFCDNVATACGTGFTPSTVTFGTGITVSNIVAVSNTELTAKLTISQTAAIQSYTPTVMTGAENASETGGFSVLAGVPALLTASPSSAQAGATTNVVITGQFTTFQAAFSTVSFGSGVTVNFITSVTPTQLTANITVATNAAVGSRTVTVTTNSQVVSLSNAFNVTAGTPVITEINPNIGNPGQNLTVTLTGQYTNWSSSTLVTIGGASSGISVGGATPGTPGPVVAASATATSITVNLTIAAGAPLGPADVVTSEGENVPAGFTVQAATVPAPSVAMLSPGPYYYSGDMPINSSIVAVFSQPMLRSTINTSTVLLQLSASNGQQSSPYIQGTVTLDATGRVLTFTPNSLLPVNSTFYFNLTGSIQDAAGVALPNFGNYLYTTFSADSTPPGVIAANPPANATNIGTNVIPQLEFSVPMNQSTSAGMTVSSSGGTVAGTYTWNSAVNCNCGEGNILTFTPTSPLTPNTVYTVSYTSALTDTAGNALVPGSFTFTTGAGSDTVTNTSGSDFTSVNLGSTNTAPSGLLNAPTNFAPRMNYSKPVNPIDINTSTLLLYNNDSGKYIPGTVTVAPNGLSAQFTPSVALLPNTYYRFYQAGGSYDADGNTLNGVNDYFTTGTSSDTTAPTVLSISPANNATSVPLNAEVIVHFSTPIDPDTVSNSVTVTPSGGSPASESCSLASDQVTLMCAASTGLQPATVYSVQVSGFYDVAGNLGTTFNSSFTTASSPLVINVSTGLNAGGSLITTNNTPDAHWIVTLTGTSASGPTSDEAIGLLAATTTSTPPCVQSGGVCSTQPLLVVGQGDTGFYSSWSADGPTSDWINIYPNSTTGSTFGVYSTTFNIPGPTVPANLCLVGAMGIDDNGKLALNGTIITGNYNDTYNLSATAAQVNVPISSDLVVGTNTLSLVWGSTDNSYEAFRLQGTIATCGSTYAGGLTIVSATPTSGSSSVSTATNIKFTFNHSLDPATVNATTLPVMIGWNSNQEIEGTYVLSTTTLPNDTVTFTPDSPFPTSTTIYVGNCYGPYDLAGETLYSGCYTDQFYYFTTGATATAAGSPFQVVAFSPANNATNVGLRTPIAATFNRSIDLNSVNSNDYTLWEGDGTNPAAEPPQNGPWCSGGSYTHSQDDTTIIFNCGILPSSSTMTAELSSGLTDWQGNPLTPAYASTFTTSYYDSNTNGTIVSYAPGNGASGVADNLPLVLYGNLPFNSTNPAAGIEVAQNGTPLPGSVQVIDNGYTLVFTPSATLQPGALIQWWTNSALTDTTYSTPFNTASGYFFVAASTATLTPTVETMSPTNGSANIPLNSFFDVQFNTPLNASTVIPANVFLYDSTTGLHPSVNMSQPEPNVVRLVPTSALPVNHYIYLNVTANLQSTTSVPASVCTNCKYVYTGTTTDSTLPTIVSSVPFNGATDVGINVDPGVVISKTVDPVSVTSTTFTVSNGGTPLAGSFFFNNTNTRIQFEPNTALPANTVLTMTLNGVLDTVGNSINFTSSFTTGNGPDYTRPSVVSTSVSNSATVPVNPSISIQFSESMDVTTFSTYNGSGSCGDVYIYDTLLGACVPATLSSSSDQSIFYLVPTSPLAAGRTYYLYVNTGDDLAGNELNGFSTTFYADLSASPATTVLAFNPSNGATGVGTNAIIEAEFSAPIDPTTLSGVTLTHGGSTIATTTVLQSGDTVVQLVPTIPLAANTVYSINVTGVKDTTEAAVPAASSTFTTGATFDTSALAIVTVSPATNSTVETNVTPQIEYNKPLNPTTVNNNTFRLYTTNPNTEIPITVTLSANLKVVTLTPVYPLESGTEYQFSGGWGNGPQDEDGNYLNAGWYYFYTSTGTDTHPPTVTVSPANDATGIPLNAQVIALVSAQVDPTTVGQNAIKVSTGGNPIAGTVTLVNNQQINFAPSSPLVAGDVYTVSVGNFTDVNGNSVTPSNTSFTAGTAATTPGLSLVQSDDNPAYGATGVSPSTTITLQFTQNLDPATVNTSTLEVMNTWNSNQGLPGTWVVNPAQPNQVTFTPAEPFPYGAQIYVGECGGPTDVLGEVFYNGSCWQQYLDVFTIVSGTQGTQGTQPLTVMSVSPANGATNVLTNAPVSVTFNNPVTYSSWDSAPNNILLYAGQGSPRTGGNITISADGRTLTFNGGVLNSGTTYTLDLPAGGITDEYGSSLTSIYTSTFTTASTEYGQGNGSITSTNPTNTTGVPTDNLLTLYVNRPVNPSTLAGNLVVTVNGSVYPGTVTAQAGGYEVQYTPNTPFPNSATVQWWFSNVEDVNGDLINSDNGYFYTAAAPVASGVPQVVALSPVEGASNVPANAEFDIEYNIPLLASTVNSTNVRVYDGNTGYLPTSAYTVTQPEPNIIRVQANPGPWTLNTEFYTCVESGVTSTATPPVPVTGNCWTDYFDPTLNSDTTPGTLTIGPPNGTSNVGTNAYFLVSFSKPFDQATFNSTNVQVTTGGNPVAGSWSYSTSNGITGEYFYPVNPLNASTTYQVSVSGILDYAGNAFNSATSTFTTGAAPDFTTPGITLDFPSNQTGVSTTASFTCHYSEAMDPATITSSNTYVFSDVTNSAVPAIITLSGDLMSATITPNSPLPANSEFYYQCYYATDLTGNGQSNAYAYFYTGSGPTTTGPQLVYANPPSGYTNVPLNSNQGPWNSTSLDLLFNEPVATESLSKITLTPTNPAGSALPIGVYAQDGNYIASIALPYALQPNTTYTFNFAGVTDYNGNPASGTTTSSFTTGSSFDFTNPVTSSEVPVNGTGNTGAPFFPVNGQPSITFSEAINPVTVNPSNVYLRLHNNTSVTVPATVSISADYKTVTVTPTAPLQPSTIYDLLYYPNNFYLYDIAGNYDGNYAVFSTFTTGPAIPVNGVCGSANGQTVATPPTTNLCSAGTASSLLNNAGTVSWTCNGESTGTNASCSATITPAQACYAAPSGLVSWWKGDNSALDQQGLNNGTLENGVTYGLGEVNNAFSLNGSDQYVLIGQPVPASLQFQSAMTLSAWINPTAIPSISSGGYYGLIVGGQYAGSTAGAGVYINGPNYNSPADAPPGGIVWVIGDGSHWYEAYTTTQVPLNQWTLVTATASAGNPLQVYFNGVAQPVVNNGTTTTWTGTASYTNSWFAIGQEDYYNRPFTGLIDEVQAYDTALTAAQIQGIYNAGDAGVCP